MKKILTLVLLLVCVGALEVSGDSTAVRHVVVYRESGSFGGWPANHGIWSWGNEIVVGFEIGYFKIAERGHSIDYSRPAEHVLARSKDGGETWTIEHPDGLRPPEGIKIAGVPSGKGGKEPIDCPGGIDFTHPDFALTARMADIHIGPSRFYYSLDRGKSWSGPFRIPNFGQKGIAARTDYLVDGPKTLTIFLTAAKSGGIQGRAICARTKDAGKTWNFVSFVGPEPGQGDKAIMPSSVRLSPSEILTARRQKQFIDTYRSLDNGVTWEPAGIAIPDTGLNNGNPPHLIRLKDGRLVLTYGFRSEPYGIRARLSRDQGRSWSGEIFLRQDGGTWDLGYTRTIQRPDGKLVTVYYFNDSRDGERYIAATIWDPDGPEVAGR